MNKFSELQERTHAEINFHGAVCPSLTQQNKQTNKSLQTTSSSNREKSIAWEERGVKKCSLTFGESFRILSCFRTDEISEVVILSSCLWSRVSDMRKVESVEYVCVCCV